MAILMQISANTGPAECCLAVTKLLEHVESRARAQGLTVTLLEDVPAAGKGLLQSALLALEGEEGVGQLFGQSYQGTIQWVCSSPFRPNHKRKNWFVDVALFPPPEHDFGNEVRFETMRASGPGGQHVNKTESAVRATHVGTGLSVKVSGSRSQSSNKAAALALLSSKVRDLVEQADQEGRAARRLRHCSRAGGAVTKRFVGLSFSEA
jgi:peptide chain release factor